MFDDYYPEQILAILCLFCLANMGLLIFIVAAARNWRADQPIVPGRVKRPFQRVGGTVRRILGTEGRQRYTWRRRMRVAVRAYGRCQYHKSPACLGRIWPWQKGDPDGNGKYSHLGHVDHVVPVAAGGRNIGNMAWSCSACNLEKGAATEGWEPDPLTPIQRLISVVMMFLLADFPSIRDF